MPNKKDTGGIYQSLPTSEKTMDNHVLSYKSPFTYADIKKSDGYSSFVDIEDSREEEYEQAKQSCLLRSVAVALILQLENILNLKYFPRFLTHFLTALSYFFFVVTFPISIFFCVKTLRQEERLVVFRLGKMIGKEKKVQGDLKYFHSFTAQARRGPAECWSSPGWIAALRQSGDL